MWEQEPTEKHICLLYNQQTSRKVSFPFVGLYMVGSGGLWWALSFPFVDIWTVRWAFVNHHFSIWLLLGQGPGPSFHFNSWWVLDQGAGTFTSVSDLSQTKVPGQAELHFLQDQSTNSFLSQSVKTLDLTSQLTIHPGPLSTPENFLLSLTKLSLQPYPLCPQFLIFSVIRQKTSGNPSKWKTTIFLIHWWDYDRIIVASYMAKSLDDWNSLANTSKLQ